jgi:hypothetical protein
MRKLSWIVGTFATMYFVATIVGFATYLLLSPTAMWISVFTLMPIVSAVLMYGYLRKMQFDRKASLVESWRLLLVWIGLSFSLDALTYILIIPSVNHTTRNWTFFRDQSPWIWLSYSVLLISMYAGRWAYLRSLDAM